MKKKPVVNFSVYAVSRNAIMHSKRDYSLDIDKAQLLIAHEIKAWHGLHCKVKVVRDNGYVIYEDKTDI